jgi:ectoine hydroxylase-related dioxygenase (phytanoyl-CoA dioxygenase family)
MGKLTNALQPVLGPDFQLVPDEYQAYYIPVTDRAAGTPPHRDSLRTATSIEPDGTPTLVNVWIPLTDATTLNSCMYVLPAQVDPHYPHRGGTMSPGKIELRTSDLPNIRALPAAAGSVLCWSTHLVHWGARSSANATQPRISFAVYYQSRSVPPYHEVTRDIPSALSLSDRLSLIEKVWRRVGSRPPGSEL